jgi:geranylgeranyl reductase family protein
MKWDVVVVGAGPTGSRVAYHLAGLGFGVAVLERRPDIGGKAACTGIIGRECVEAFAIDETTILRQADSATLFSPSGNRIELHREEPQAYILDRAAFNRAMAQRARSKGAEYYLNTPVESIKSADDKVTIETAQGNFAARAAVIAAGFGSGLTDGLGKFADFTAGAQAEIESKSAEVEVYFGREVAPGFFAWLVPTSPGKARVGLLSRENPTLYLKRLLTSLAADSKIASAEVGINHGAVPLKPLPRTYGDRLLVVGDAAGHVKPTTGGGIYYGLLGADIAAQTLRKALQSNDLSARSLARYEREWQQLLGRELRTGYWARKLFEKLSDGQIDNIFDIVKRNGINEALLKEKDLSFDWHSKAILKLLGHQVVASAVNVFRLPRN